VVAGGGRSGVGSAKARKVLDLAVRVVIISPPYAAPIIKKFPLP
jgi:hypothetical protein